MRRVQDTTGAGVRVGITYQPGTRPTLLVVGRRGAESLDSVRAIVARDLDHSDRFEPLPPLTGAAGDSLLLAVVAGRRSERGAGIVVAVDTARGGQAARVLVTEGATGRQLHAVQLPLDGALRRAAHAAADAAVRAVFGEPGAASTALLFVREGRIWRVDADGHGAASLRTAGAPALSPAWSPDGRSFVYAAYVRSGQPLVAQDMASGARRLVSGTELGLNITPAVSPEGRRLAFAHGTESGTDIYLTGYPAGSSRSAGGRLDWIRLTAGRGDNLSPAWSPDGGRIAFISTRPGTPQLYLMNADGTGQEVLARFDYGATGTTSSPAWSPDGRLISFHREVGGVPQLFVVDVSSRAVRQLTGSGRNEDPTWAPDSRHLAFVSSRGGARDLWVLDLETGRMRQVTRFGGARLPAWSPPFTATTGEGN